MRIREYSSLIPKPMVPVGTHPILWHVMKYYAHYGHTDFILCLGHQGDVIRRAFEDFPEFLSNEFVPGYENKGREHAGSDVGEWNITFVDTGVDACVGERLVKVRRFLDEDEVFLANYADGVSNVHLPNLINVFRESDSIATCVGVRPNYSFHLINPDDDGLVSEVTPVRKSGLWINGGFFVFGKELFDFIEPGEDLVDEPFGRLARAGKFSTYRHEGFWACMDTFKEKMALDEIHSSGKAVWEVWNEGNLINAESTDAPATF